MVSVIMEYLKKYTYFFSWNKKHKLIKLSFCWYIFLYTFENFCYRNLTQYSKYSGNLVIFVIFGGGGKHFVSSNHRWRNWGRRCLEKYISVKISKQNWAIPGNSQTWSGIGDWGYGISRGIQERACGSNCRGQLKRKWNFQGCLIKTRGISMGLGF